MDTKQDASQLAGGPSRNSTPDSLMFIDMANPSQTSRASTRKKVRSHVMSRHHRRARKSRASGPPQGLQIAPASESFVLAQENQQLANFTQNTSQSIGLVVQGAQSFMSQALHLHPPYMRIERWNSPFLQEIHDSQRLMGVMGPKTPELSRLSLPDNFPFQLDRRDQNLLFHYVTVFNYTNMAVNSKEEWIKVAVTDSALLHWTLVISALHITLIRGKTFSVDAFRHQREAVKILNTRLNDPLLSTTDSTILSISTFALAECLNAQPHKAVSPLKALEELVKQRGGLHALGFNGLVRRKVLWADISCAISLKIPPIFPYTSGILPPFPPDIIQIASVALAANTCTREVSDFTATSYYTSEISNIIHSLEQLSLVISLSDRSDMSKVDQLLLCDHFYDVERRTYDLLQAEIQNQSRTTVSSNIPSSLYTACCFTALIYIYLALREIPPGAGSFNMPVESLTAVAQEIDIFKACANYPKTLLWILGTGGAAALGKKQRAWYVKQLDDFCQYQKIFEWDSMKIAFGSPMHLAPNYMKEFMNVWDEAEELRIMRGLEI